MKKYIIILSLFGLTWGQTYSATLVLKKGKQISEFDSGQRLIINNDTKGVFEGINLHRANIVVNYDLPWNPTRVLQRVGRVNRVGTDHEKIFIYNFFPTDQSEQEIHLEANIVNKIQAFHDTLGEDSKYLTEQEEVSVHNLFGDNLVKKLGDKKTYESESESEDTTEFKYLEVIRDVRDNEPILFKRIRDLPKKSRSVLKKVVDQNELITFFRKDKLKKFIHNDGITPKELTFFQAVD